MPTFRPRKIFKALEPDGNQGFSLATAIIAAAGPEAPRSISTDDVEMDRALGSTFTR
jgi:hypothetical protein